MSPESTEKKSSRKMRIVILHPHFTIAGGAGNFVLETGSRLVESGYEVFVVCIRVNQALISSCNKRVRFIETGGKLTSSLLHWLLFPFFLIRLIYICRSLKPDLIFPQVFPANWWGFIYKKIFPRTRLLWMCQEPSAFIHSRTWIAAIRDPIMNLMLRSFNPALKSIDRWLAHCADHIFANSHYGAEYAQRIYNYSADKLEPLYLGVSQIFRDADSLSYNERRPQVITICRLTKFKNVDLIIRALKKLIERGRTDVELKIVGRGEEEENLRNLIKSLGLSDNVHLCGALSNQALSDEIRHSRAFVLASVDEPFGLAVVEAMACGTPAIVVRSGGPSEIVQHELSGFHIPPDDTDQMLNYLDILISQEEQFTRLSRAARERSMDFNWDKTTAKIDQTIKRMLSQQT